MSIRVVVVEDSATQRAMISSALREEHDIVVAGEAADVETAARLVRDLRPDVVTMDLDIPGGNGALGGEVAIRRIMAASPVPILVLSHHAPSRADTAAIAALDAGAADVLPKGVVTTPEGRHAFRRRVRLLSGVAVVARRLPVARAAGTAATAGAGTVGTPAPAAVIALAASTGGPAALRCLLPALRGVRAPILVAQHLHPDFVESFARWLETETGLTVLVVGDVDAPLRPGVVHVPPPGCHLRLGAARRAELSSTPDVLSVPSADELLDSVARRAGARGVGAVLTGMGSDGAAGLLALRRAGGRTIAQDGTTATVDGMPRAARERGAAEFVLPLGEIGPALARLAAVVPAGGRDG